MHHVDHNALPNLNLNQNPVDIVEKDQSTATIDADLSLAAILLQSGSQHSTSKSDSSLPVLQRRGGDCCNGREDDQDE